MGRRKIEGGRVKSIHIETLLSETAEHQGRVVEEVSKIYHRKSK